MPDIIDIVAAEQPQARAEDIVDIIADEPIQEISPAEQAHEYRKQISNKNREHWAIGATKAVGKEIGMGFVGAAETSMALASGALLYVPSKIWGLVNSVWGEEAARAAEEDMARIGYQALTTEGQEAIGKVSKLFELGLLPAKKAGEQLKKMGYPTLGYWLETGGEFATFATAGAVTGAIKGARTPKPVRPAGIPKKPLPSKPRPPYPEGGIQRLFTKERRMKKPVNILEAIEGEKAIQYAKESIIEQNRIGVTAKKPYKRLRPEIPVKSPKKILTATEKRKAERYVETKKAERERIRGLAKKEPLEKAFAMAEKKKKPIILTKQELKAQQLADEFNKINPDTKIKYNVGVQKFPGEKPRYWFTPEEGTPQAGQSFAIENLTIKEIKRALKEKKKAFDVSDLTPKEIADIVAGKKSDVSLESMGFQTMYEGFRRAMRRKRGEKPREGVKDFTTGAIVKQRSWKREGKIVQAPPIYAGEASVIKGIKELPAGILEHKLQNPIRIFENYLGSDAKELIYRPVIEAYDRIARGNKIFAKRVKELKKGVSSKSRKNVQVYAIAQQAGGRARLKHQGIKEIPKLTPKEMTLYNELEGIYEGLYHRLNQARKLAGKEPFPKIKNYAPFIHDLGILEQMGLNPGLEKLKILNPQFIKLKTTPFKYAKKRAPFYEKKLELDCFDVLERYGNTSIKHIQLSPVIGKLREFLLTIGKGKEAWKLVDHAPNSARWLNAWINFQAGQKPLTLPRVLERGLTKLNQNLAFSILGANVRSALIQPSALMQTYVEIGPQYTIRGIESLLHPAKRNFALEKSNVLLARNYDVTVRDAFDIIRTGKVGAVKTWAGKKALAPLRILDMETARATWQGAYEKGIKELNYTERKAINYADDVVTKTQASASPADMAPIQRTALGKSVSLFQTFVINEWNFMVNDVLGMKNPNISNATRVRRISRFIAGTILINTFYEDILGINSPFPSPIKAYREAIDRGDDWPSVSAAREVAEKIPLIGGGLRYRTIGPASVEYLRRIAEGKRTKETILALGGVPGVSQAAKTARAKKRGEPPVGQILGRYTPARKKKKKTLRTIKVLD